MKPRVGDKVVVQLGPRRETLVVTDTPEDRPTDNAIWFSDQEYRGVAVPQAAYNGMYFLARNVVSIERVFRSGDQTITILLEGGTVTIRHKQHFCCGGSVDTVMEAPATVQQLAEDTYADQIAEGSMTPDECVHDHKIYPCAKEFF